MNRYIAFQKIIEPNSFTKAGEALGYSQSAISQMVNCRLNYFIVLVWE